MTETEFLDGLQAILIKNIQSLFKQAGKDTTYEEASNILSKIGTRIMFTKEMSKDQVDKILLKK